MPDMPRTPAIDALEHAAIPYRAVAYGRVQSAEEAADARGIALGALAKTLVIRRDEDDYVLVLVPGDGGLDYKKLRAHLDVRRLTMPDPDEAKAATGYERGTITPLGAGEWPTIIDSRLMSWDEISLGSGVHGWAIHLDPNHLVNALAFVEVADVSG